MREIEASRIKDAVAELCLKANFELRPDVLKAIKAGLKKEAHERPRGILRSIIENARIAKSKRLAICQDTGMVSVFLEVGQDVHITGGDLEEAVNAGVKEAYRRGYLRKSIVEDPILRKNTADNTPGLIHIDIVKGERLKVAISPKGFGSENKCAIKMFRPTDTLEAVKDFVLDTVKRAGPDACPPFVIGIGIGGTFDGAALVSKKALLRPIDRRNPARHLAKLERELLADINSLRMGPMGLGGKATALGVNIEGRPTHIAGLPVAVTVSCHATRLAEKVL